MCLFILNQNVIFPNNEEYNDRTLVMWYGRL